MVGKYTELRCSFVAGLSKTLLIVIVLSHCQRLVAAQSNGDVRIRGMRMNDTLHKEWGRLELYLGGEWGTFCAAGFDSFAADAACRQLGYRYSVGDEISKAIDYTEYLPLASNSTTIFAGISVCGTERSEGPSHVLRCIVPDLYGTGCTHDDDVIIFCSVKADGYDMKLRLNSEAFNSTYQSSGVLEIYSNSLSRFWGWRNICGTKFDQNAADTACIQMGYTGALSYTTHANHSSKPGFTDIWLDGVTCGDKAYQCLDSCFCYPQTPTAVQCDSGNVIALTCTFDLAKRYTVDAGTRDWCEEENVWKSYCVTSTEPPITLIVVSSVLSAIIVVLCLVVVGLTVMVCYSYCSRRGKARYQTVGVN